MLAEFSPVTGLFVPTERRSRMDHVVRVDPDRSGMHCLREPMSPPEISGPDSG